MHKLIAATAIALAAASIAGCTENKPTDDLGDDVAIYDETGWTVVLNYDEFPNVGYRCIGSDKLYVTTREADPVDVVPNSPDCRDGGS